MRPSLFSVVPHRNGGRKLSPPAANAQNEMATLDFNETPYVGGAISELKLSPDGIDPPIPALMLLETDAEVTLWFLIIDYSSRVADFVRRFNRRYDDQEHYRALININGQF